MSGPRSLSGRGGYRIRTRSAKVNPYWMEYGISFEQSDDRHQRLMGELWRLVPEDVRNELRVLCHRHSAMGDTGTPADTCDESVAPLDLDVLVARIAAACPRLDNNTRGTRIRMDPLTGRPVAGLADMPNYVRASDPATAQWITYKRGLDSLKINEHLVKLQTNFCGGRLLPARNFEFLQSVTIRLITHNVYTRFRANNDKFLISVPSEIALTEFSLADGVLRRRTLPIKFDDSLLTLHGYLDPDSLNKIQDDLDLRARLTGIGRRRDLIGSQPPARTIELLLKALRNGGGGGGGGDDGAYVFNVCLLSEYPSLVAAMRSMAAVCEQSVTMLKEVDNLVGELFTIDEMVRTMLDRVGDAATRTEKYGVIISDMLLDNHISLYTCEGHSQYNTWARSRKKTTYEQRSLRLQNCAAARATGICHNFFILFQLNCPQFQWSDCHHNDLIDRVTMLTPQSMLVPKTLPAERKLLKLLTTASVEFPYTVDCHEVDPAEADANKSSADGVGYHEYMAMMFGELEGPGPVMRLVNGQYVAVEEQRTESERSLKAAKAMEAELLRRQRALEAEENRDCLARDSDDDNMSTVLVRVDDDGGGGNKKASKQIRNPTKAAGNTTTKTVVTATIELEPIDACLIRRRRYRPSTGLREPSERPERVINSKSLVSCAVDVDFEESGFRTANAPPRETHSGGGGGGARIGLGKSATSEKGNNIQVHPIMRHK